MQPNGPVLVRPRCAQIVDQDEVLGRLCHRLQQQHSLLFGQVVQEQGACHYVKTSRQRTGQHIKDTEMDRGLFGGGPPCGEFDRPRTHVDPMDFQMKTGPSRPAPQTHRYISRSAGHIEHSQLLAAELPGQCGQRRPDGPGTAAEVVQPR